MRTIKVTLAYDGTTYLGWQVQARGPTIQAKIEEALLNITGQRVRATASGRTDSGVHAFGQVFAARLETRLSNHELCRALAASTPFDIEIINVEDADEAFDPIRHAKRKRYRYVIQHGQPQDVFDRLYSWHFPKTLNVESMKQAANCLLGEHDFASFQSSGSERATTVRTIYEISVEPRHQRGAAKIDIEIEADGFLYNMVRIIIGSLVDIGRGKNSVAWMQEILDAKDRAAAGMKAPPHGLYLMWVAY